MAVGDFNGDSHLDAVYCVVNEYFPSFPRIRLGKGDGTFGAEVPNAFNALFAGDGLYESCGTGSVLTVGDFNGDGKLDVAAAGFSLAIYLGRGDGTFLPGIVTEGPLTSNYPTTGVLPLIAADFNKDGKTDLVYGTSVWLGIGDGTFRFSQMLLAPAQAVGDFNGDGNLDLITGTGSAFVNFGIGNGTFESPLGPIPGSNGFIAVVAADFNGDGMVDVAFEGPSSGLTPTPNQAYYYFNWQAQIVVALGLNNGSFQTPLSPVPALSGPLIASDLNGDGKIDLTSGRSLLMGAGDGTFRSAEFLEGCGGFSSQTNYCSDKGVALGDFNGDGLPDIFLGNSFHTLVGGAEAAFNVYLNDSPGDGLWIAGVSAATGTWPVGGDSIASAYGVNLAPSTESASGLPLPKTLGGIQVLIAGHAAQLLYVSPSQINFIVPKGSDQMVSIGIQRNGTNYFTKGMAMPIYPVSPTFFLVNQATNVPAATAVQVHSDATQTNVPVYSCSTMGCVAVPIDVSGDPVYLSLYGTGFSDNVLTTPPLSESPHCLLGDSRAGVMVQPSFSGQQPSGTPGLDQMNILLPNSLKGMGVIPVNCSFSPNLYGLTDPANTVHIQIK